MSSQSLLLCEVGEFLRKNYSRRVHINTIRRWADKGIKVNGRPVKLRSQRLGKYIHTTPEWIEKFVQECSGTEPALVTERQGTPPEVLMRLKARGFDGPEEKRKVLGVSKRSGHSRTMRKLLPVSPLRDQDEQDNRAGINRAGSDVAGVQIAAI